MNQFEKPRKSRIQLLPLAAKHGARNMRVFGSLARGDERADSDIDFLVEMVPDRSLMDIGGLQMDLQETLAHRVDVVTGKGLKRRIRAHVMRDGKA